MLPTDNLLFSNSFPKTYRYRHRSVIILELMKLPLPIPIPLPLQWPLFASLSLSAVKGCLLVTCSRPQRPQSCTQTCWAVHGEKATHGRGPCIKLCLFLQKNEKLPLRYLDSRSLNPAEKPRSPQSASLRWFPLCFPLFCCLFFSLSLSLSTCAKGQTVKRDWSRVAIPPTIYRAPDPEFPKLLWRLLEKLAGKLGALGGVLGELLWRLPLLYSSRLRIGFWQRVFFFAGIFHIRATGYSRRVCPRIVSLHFCGENARKILQENPRQTPQKFIQRKRDDNKNKICAFRGGGGQGGREENCPKRFFFRGKRHDNKILKVKMLLSRNFVVMAQAPIYTTKIPNIFVQRGQAQKARAISRAVSLALPQRSEFRQQFPQQPLCTAVYGNSSSGSCRWSGE